MLERLAAHASFSASRELALSLRPSSSYEEVSRRQRESAEARRLLEKRLAPSVGGATDVRPAAEAARVGSLLEPAQLLEVHDALTACRRVAAGLRRLAGDMPTLAGLAEPMQDLPKLEEAIERSIGPRGEVLDSASPLLRDVRRQLQAAHDRLSARLNDVLASGQWRQMVQEPIVTLRGGRYVIPVKAEFRGEFPGLVHDVSTSGATVFMEPLSVVDLGNTWREMQIAEEREVERILRSLSADVGAHADVIVTNVEALAAVDLALAKARYADAIRAVEPRLLPPGNPRRLRLVDARHPLLTGPVVPITVEVGSDFAVLLITGPNTGGKTVALKTCGLLALMAQAGLPVPAAEGCQLPVYDHVLADIGDEQSIEQSLSTFSSHMSNIIAILNAATPDSILLLDELAAGTDPTEGSALARALLTYLLERGVSVIATTHHSELKAFAQATPGVANASVEFDTETLTPTYRLHIGLPGRSNAIAIAARLGLPERLVGLARDFLAPGTIAVEELLSEIQRQRDVAQAQAKAAAAEREAAQADREAVAEQLRQAEEERQRVVERTESELLAEAEDLRDRLRRISSDISLLEQERRQRLEPIRQEAMAVRRRLRRHRHPPRPAVERPRELKVGATVRLRDLGQQVGELLTVPSADGEVEVLLGNMRLRLPADRVEPVAGPVTRPPQAVTHRYAARPAVSPELHLRAMRADAALESLEQYLNDAYLAGLHQVRIVHGKGEGILRRLVREELSRHRLVASFRPGAPEEGGEGVTVAEIAV